MWFDGLTAHATEDCGVKRLRWSEGGSDRQATDRGIEATSQTFGGLVNLNLKQYPDRLSPCRAIQRLR